MPALGWLSQIQRARPSSASFWAQLSAEKEVIQARRVTDQ
jgi:hypothetical protein